LKNKPHKKTKVRGLNAPMHLGLLKIEFRAKLVGLIFFKIFLKSE
jgi:hypothetical protein